MVKTNADLTDLCWLDHPKKTLWLRVEHDTIVGVFLSGVDDWFSCRKSRKNPKVFFIIKPYPTMRPLKNSKKEKENGARKKWMFWAFHQFTGLEWCKKTFFSYCSKKKGGTFFTEGDDTWWKRTPIWQEFLRWLGHTKKNLWLPVEHDTTMGVSSLHSAYTQFYKG